MKSLDIGKIGNKHMTAECRNLKILCNPGILSIMCRYLVKKSKHQKQNNWCCGL